MYGNRSLSLVSAIKCVRPIVNKQKKIVGPSNFNPTKNPLAVLSFPPSCILFPFPQEWTNARIEAQCYGRTKHKLRYIRVHDRRHGGVTASEGEAMGGWTAVGLMMSS